MKPKCKHDLPPGFELKFNDGVEDYFIDPCSYVVTEVHQNVTVEVSRCKICGHIQVGWTKQDDTISDYFEEE